MCEKKYPEPPRPENLPPSRLGEAEIGYSLSHPALGPNAYGRNFTVYFKGITTDLAVACRWCDLGYGHQARIVKVWRWSQGKNWLATRNGGALRWHAEVKQV